MSDPEKKTATQKPEPGKEKTFWNNPKVERENGQIIGVHFRDGYLQMKDGNVAGYLDSDRGILLVPDTPAEDGRVYTWKVLDTDEKPTGATWRGTIEFVNNSVVIEQVHNGLRRTYIADGCVETEYRTSRVTEVPGKRKTIYRNGTKIEEDLNSSTMTITYDDRVVTRKADGSALTEFFDTDVSIETNAIGEITYIVDQNGECRLEWDEDGRVGVIRYV